MKIVIGNYTDPNDNRNLILNSGIHDYLTGDEISSLMTLITSVSGLETAPYRNGTGNWSGADGGYLGTQLYGAREITISGVYVDKNAKCNFGAEVSSQFDRLARLYIRSRLPIRVKQTVRIFLDNGMTFFTDGYCTNLNMEYTYSGYGDYQITMFCPDPALYRGAASGAINSDWNSASLMKSQSVGYDASKLIHYPYRTPADREDAKMYKDTTMPDDNHGIEWGTGGRSTPINYTGDYPGYPQLIVSVGSGEVCVNPSFYSMSEDKIFSLGAPDTTVAVFRVTSKNAAGAITGLETVSAGAYDADYSGRKILMQGFPSDGEVTAGYGAYLNLTAEQTAGGTWEFTDIEINNGGENYEVNDLITPMISGAAIMTITEGHKLVVDMAEHTVMIYSGENFSHKASYSYYITPGSEWFSLQPLSVNNITFSSANPSDTNKATIQWRNGYAGI